VKFVRGEFPMVLTLLRSLMNAMRHHLALMPDPALVTKYFFAPQVPGGCQSRFRNV
jgi:hypothetical protein